MRYTLTMSVAAVAAVLSFTASAASSFTYVDLVHRLTDLEGLAVLPAPGETCAQWSSYDRASQHDPATGKYLGWDANGDGNGVIRKEGNQVVMAEMKGPGCIWRMWSATPKEGHVRIYLDGAAEPAVDLPFRSFFDGKNAPFNRGALVHTVAMGWNNYTPVPYQKSCKIVADPNWGDYFQFVYTTFPSGTKVPTFKRELSSEERAALDRANRTLTTLGAADWSTDPDNVTVTQTITVPPGGKATMLKLDGARAIRTIRAKVNLPPTPQDRQALRELTFSVRWDGEPAPSVWAPFGDFFGTAAGASRYRSLPSGLTEDGIWYSHWYMPFAKEAVLELGNDGSEARTVSFEVIHAPLRRPISELARFHAKWHRDAFLPKDPDRRKIDWTLLTTEGQGRFLGVMLHVWNPRGGWWGEGDEKFFVDGEKFPSTIGTGSEDYFGYAWCNPTLFQNAYHNQTISMNNKGHVCVNRWHIMENVPFQRGFEGAIEKYYPNGRPTLYASTVYWYLAPGGKDPYTPQPLSERSGYWAEIETFQVKGALEGEKMKVLSKTAGNPQVQDMSGYEGQWSNDAHLWWTGAKPGDKLELALPVSKEGRYRLLAHFTKAVDYAIAQPCLDGKKLGEPIDFFDPQVVPTQVMDLGICSLTEGDHTFTIEIVGANPNAVKAYMVGLDYLKLEPAP